jgi:hypothetical protein
MGIVLLVVISIPVLLPMLVFETWRVPRWQRWRLARQGRYVRWSDCVDRFAAGQGTLIVQYLWSPHTDGPLLEWWTDDDIIASFRDGMSVYPVLSSGIDADDYFEQSRQFADQYLDLEAGSALVTKGPKRAGWTFRAGKGRQLHRQYPLGKIVTVYRTKHHWFAMRGDADVLFSSLAAADA